MAQQRDVGLYVKQNQIQKNQENENFKNEKKTPLYRNGPESSSNEGNLISQPKKKREGNLIQSSVCGSRSTIKWGFSGSQKCHKKGFGGVFMCATNLARIGLPVIVYTGGNN